MGAQAELGQRDVSLLVLSPHLDDAALSCGALLARACDSGAAVSVVSIFTGAPTQTLSPAAACWHARCGLGGDNVMEVRAQEDWEACALLGALPIHLGIGEALYRPVADGTGPRYPDAADIFGPVAEADAEIGTQLAESLRALPQWHTADVVLAPLGVGGHVDHVVTREAVLDILRPSRLLLYEEVPYVLYERCAGWERTLAGRLAPTPVAAQPGHWQRKLDAISCYRSQLEVLWEHPERWPADLAAHAERACDGHRGERYWGLRPC
jgi:LmbE family N-acetylglucosaminyl deacetylase